MELRGVDGNGKAVSASVTDLANKVKRPTEDMQMGSSPTSYVYRDRGTNETREVDLQEVAQASGIANVQFHFDPKAARSKGLIQNAEVDQGVAYNLERIKTDEGRAKYLADMGYSQVLRDGDDYYSIANGKFVPINNKLGLDLSDVVRMGASAGRDVGAAIATTAAVGSGAATGGATLAAAGAAGAFGATIGEAAQRGVDKLVGAAADKYNRDLSLSEEATAAGKTALVGAAQGVAQPLLAAAGVVAKENVVAPLLERGAKTFSSDWMAAQAAKTKSSALLARMPGGYMAGFASAEEAAANDAIRSTLNRSGEMLAKKEITGQEALAVANEAKQAVASGAAKPSTEEAIAREAEAVAQGSMRSAWQSQALQQAEQNSAKRKVEQQAQAEIDDALRAKNVEFQERARDAFADKKKELEHIFNPDGDVQTAISSQRSIVADRAGRMARSAGVKLETDPVSNQVIGFESGSLDKFLGKKINEVTDVTQEYVQALRRTDGLLDMAPPDAVRGQTVRQIQSAISGLGNNPEHKEVAMTLLKEIRDFGVKTTDKGALTDAMEGVIKAQHAILDDPSTPRSVVRAFQDIFNATEVFDTASAKSRDLARALYQTNNKLAEIKNELRVNGTVFESVEKEKFNNILTGLVDLNKVSGDPTATRTRPLFEALHMDHLLRSGPETPSPYRSFLSPDARDKMDVLQYIKDYAPKGRVIDTVSGEDKQARKGTAAVIGGLVSKATGGSFFEGAAAGYASGALLPKHLTGGAKMAGDAAKAVAKGAVAKGKAIIEGAEEVASSKVGRATASYVKSRTAAEVVESKNKKK